MKVVRKEEPNKKKKNKVKARSPEVEKANLRARVESITKHGGNIKERIKSVQLNETKTTN